MLLRSLPASPTLSRCLPVYRSLARRILRSPGWPEVVQGPLLAVTLVVAFLALWQPRHSEMNLGAALVWQLWWTLLPFFTLLAARGWCAVCPFAALGDLAQRRRSSPLPPPPGWLRRWGQGIAAAALALLGFLFLLLSLESSGVTTAAFLALFALGAAITGLLWRGRVWCRYLCPVGLLLGLYSRLSWLRLESVGLSGRLATREGARRCPLFTSPLSAQRVQDCVLCTSCLRVPGGEAVEPRATVPDLRAQKLSSASAVAVSILMGLLLADALRMTPLYLRYMARAVPALGGRYELAMALGIAAVLLLLVLVVAGAATVPATGEDLWTRFGRLGMALLPLALSAQLALSSQHLMVTGDVLRNLVSELGLVEPGHMPPADAYLFLWPMKLLQETMLALGAGVSIWFLLSKPRLLGLLPAALAISLALLLVVLFLQPMSVTC